MSRKPKLQVNSNEQIVKIEHSLDKVAKNTRKLAVSRASYDVVSLCRTHAKNAVETLVKIMSNETADFSSRVKAASIILERGYGKAINLHLVTQQISDGDLEKLVKDIINKRSIGTANSNSNSIDNNNDNGNGKVIDAQLLSNNNMGLV